MGQDAVMLDLPGYLPDRHGGEGSPSSPHGPDDQISRRTLIHLGCDTNDIHNSRQLASLTDAVDRLFDKVFENPSFQKD